MSDDELIEAARGVYRDETGRELDPEGIRVVRHGGRATVMAIYPVILAHEADVETGAITPRWGHEFGAVFSAPCAAGAATHA